MNAGGYEVKFSGPPSPQALERLCELWAKGLRQSGFGGGAGTAQVADGVAEAQDSCDEP